MVTDLAVLYSEVFAPEYFVLVCTLALVGYEWRSAADSGPAGLGARVATVAVGWVVALAVYESAPLVFDPVPPWGTDVTGSVGLGVGFLLIWTAWRARDWGDRVPAFAALLFGVTVVHAAVTPFWALSSHVAYTVAPAGYLVAADRRFAPLLAVALGMVVARPLAGAHTWLQSVAGLALAGAFLAGFRYGGLGVGRSRPAGAETGGE